MSTLMLALHKLLELDQFFNPTNWTLSFCIALPQSQNIKIYRKQGVEILGMLEVLDMNN
jgi:hypothetical protein